MKKRLKNNTVQNISGKFFRIILKIRSALPFFIIFVLFYTHVKAQDCGKDNLGFEKGDFSNWEAARYEGGYGWCNSVPLPPVCPYPPCISCQQANCTDPNDPSQCPMTPDQGFGNYKGTVNQPFTQCAEPFETPHPWPDQPRYTVMTGANGDRNTDGNISTVSTHPLAGNFSARLGNQTPGYSAECMWNRFLVTKENSIFMYSYAVILQDPINPQNQHHLYDSPRFSATLTDDSGVPVGCGGQFTSSSLDARDIGKGFKVPQNPQCNIYDPYNTINNSNIYYRDWITHGINLTDQLGQYVTIRFCTADCGRGGHFGYAYVDIFCVPPQKGYFICTHGEPVTLNGPEGFGSYRWFEGPDTTGTFMGEGRDFVVNEPEDGAMYTVSFTPLFGEECNRVEVTDTIRVFEASAKGDTTYCGIFAPDRLEYPTYSNAPNTIYTWRSIPAGYTSGDSALILTGSQVPQQNTQFIVNMKWGENSCYIEDTITIIVEQCGIGIEVPSFEYCLNATDTPSCFLIEATVTDGELPLKFTWTGLPFDPGDTDKVEVCTDVPLNYTVSVIDADSLSASASGQITVFYPPAVTIQPDSFCIGFGSGELTATVTGGNEPYTYQWNDPGNQTSPAATGLEAGTYTVTVTDAKGCWDTASSWIKTYSYEGNSWSYKDCPGAIIQLESTPGGQTYRWRPATGLSNPTARRPLATINEPITYYVRVSTGRDCGWIDTVTIEVEYEPSYTLHIPNSFTPNEDGNDDFFQYQGDFSGIVRFECQIWNRWGEKIYHTYELTDYWNGRYNNAGEYVKDGAYVYIIKARDDCAKIKKGWDYRFGWVIVLKGDADEN